MTKLIYMCLGAAERLHEVQEQLKIAQAKMSENMSSALKKKEEVITLNILCNVYVSPADVVIEWFRDKSSYEFSLWWKHCGQMCRYQIQVNLAILFLRVDNKHFTKLFLSNINLTMEMHIVKYLNLTLLLY